MNCSVYEHPTIASFCVGILLAIGIFLSYVPQHVKVIRRRSSEGLSPTYLLLGSLSGFSAFANIYIVTIEARECCRVSLNTFQCGNSMVGFIQILSQAIGGILIFVLCVFATSNSLREPAVNHEKLVTDFKIFIFYALLNVSIVIYLTLTKDDSQYNPLESLFLFADVSGLLATLFALIQYLPQLLTTYNAKHAGSLSIPMMLIQTPGGFVWSYSLWAQPNSVWSSWLPYFVSANLQLLLLLLCLYFQWKYPTELTEANAELRIAEENLLNANRHVDERSSLISS